MDKEYWADDKKFRERKQKEEIISANEAKQRVKNKAEISIKTCGIGSLNDFENAFGWLWKHGEDYEKLTPQEKKMRERWLETRDSILDRMENSKRLLLREIERTEFKSYKPNKFTTILRNKNNGDYNERY